MGEQDFSADPERDRLGEVDRQPNDGADDMADILTMAAAPPDMNSAGVKTLSSDSNQSRQ
ncbi:hypothetical protein [Streptomyces sp. NPDC054794]